MIDQTIANLANLVLKYDTLETELNTQKETISEINNHISQIPQRVAYNKKMGVLIASDKSIDILSYTVTEDGLYHSMVYFGPFCSISSNRLLARTYLKRGTSTVESYSDDGEMSGPAYFTRNVSAIFDCKAGDIIYCMILGINTDSYDSMEASGTITRIK